MLTISELKRIGTICQINNEPYQVIWTQHVQMGRGGAILRLKLKNLVTGNTLEKTVKGNDTLAEAKITKKKVNFLYSDQSGWHFMDNDTYEQFDFNVDDLGDKTRYLKDGSAVTLMLFNDQPLTIELPVKMDFLVTGAPEGVKGDTAQGKVLKQATLETGQTINVPLFVKEGDTIRINTETNEYVERV